MLIQIISLQIQIQPKASIICDNTLFKNQQAINYCAKSSEVFSAVNALLTFQSRSESNLFVYVQKMQNSQITLQINLSYSVSFSLFGLSSELSLTICKFTLNLLQNALNASSICNICDFVLIQSHVQFIAFGQVISGLVRSSNQININQSFIQVRIRAELFSSAVIFQVQINSVINLERVNISGYLTGSAESGVINQRAENNQINIESVQICSNLNNFGNGVIFNQQPISNCDICENSFYVYGICSNETENLILDNTGFKKLCSNNFVYTDKCVCSEGYVLNGSQCVNLMQVLSNSVYSQIQISDAQTALTKVQTQTNNLETEIQTIKDSLTQEKEDRSSADEQIQTQLQQLKVQVEQNNASQVDLTQINNQITALTQKTIQNENNLTVVNSSVQAELYKLKTDLNNTNNSLNTLNSTIIDLSSGTLKTQLNQINANIAAINYNMTNMRSEYINLYNSLTSQTAVQQNQIYNQQAQLNQFRSEFLIANNTQSNQLNILQNNIFTLNTSVCQLSSNVSSLNASVYDLKANVTYLKANLSKQSDLINYLDSNITQLDFNIYQNNSILNSQIVYLDQKMLTFMNEAITNHSQIENKINQLTLNQTQFFNDFSTLDSSVQTLKTNLATLTQEHNTFKTQQYARDQNQDIVINDLKAQIAQLKTEMANALKTKADKKPKCLDIMFNDLDVDYSYPFFNKAQSICCAAGYGLSGMAQSAGMLTFNYICANKQRAVILSGAASTITSQVTAFCGVFPCSPNISTDDKYYG
ncbi:CD209_antigen-like protein [Hexamita inflata]|uniref:CD209 antigen-like protein n=1 Tax=Hexamita inflata TaxID=28002 RepID=A0AA86P7Z4_9EUKA|nr:CD209 antigen-like protein [Hexamita inflata]